MALIDTPEAANRLARAIASDIELYNKEEIVEGITKDDLFERLDGVISKGLSLYKKRVTPELFENSNYYHRAIVDILVYQNRSVKSPIW